MFTTPNVAVDQRVSGETCCQGLLQSAAIGSAASTCRAAVISVSMLGGASPSDASCTLTTTIAPVVAIRRSAAAQHKQNTFHTAQSGIASGRASGDSVHQPASTSGWPMPDGLAVAGRSYQVLRFIKEVD